MPSAKTKSLPGTVSELDIGTLWLATGNLPDELFDGEHTIRSIMTELQASTIPWWKMCSQIENAMLVLALAGGDIYIALDIEDNNFIEMRISQPEDNFMFNGVLIKGYTRTVISEAVAGAYALIGTGDNAGLFTVEQFQEKFKPGITS